MSGARGKLRAAFRCDAGEAIGGGHAMRCLTLANALSEAGVEVTFVAAAMPEALAQRIAAAGHRLERVAGSAGMQREGGQWEEPPLSDEAQNADANATGAVVGQVDWLIVDHYLLDERWHSTARGFADQILVIDDLANRPYDCDILLDQTFGRSAEGYRNLVPGGAKIVAGAAYVLLRPEFARERPAALGRRKTGAPVRRILVSMGTADLGCVTACVVEQALMAAPECAIDAVMGPQATSFDRVLDFAARHDRISVHVDSDRMAELMREADIAIGAAGMTSWERCCLGLPSLALVLAENQRSGAEALAASGAALVVDNIDDIHKKLSLLIADTEAVERMSAAAFAVTDGLGTGRVLETMLGDGAQGEIRLRSATLADSEMLWLWRNDPLTRAQSRTEEPIGWKSHIKWLGAMLDRSEGCFFLAEQNGIPVGTVRFDPLQAGSHEVNIAVAPDGRGTGRGTAVLRAACARMGTGAIYASVRESNVPSRRLFESCGFKEIESSETGFLRYLLIINDSVASRRNKA